MRFTDQLRATLDKRAMPETIAAMILSGNAVWPQGLRHELSRVAASRPPSSMTDDFERPAGCADQLAAAAGVFGADASGISPADPAQLREFTAALGAGIGWTWGSDWKRDRFIHAERLVRPGFPGRRGYNRRVRVLRNLEAGCRRMEDAMALRRLVLIGRSGFACDIPAGRMAADPLAACFIAYLTARKNRRRMFSLAGKENPVDIAAQIMLDALLDKPGTDFAMLAMVHPRPEILARLSDGELGSLMGAWWSVMRDTAARLRVAFPPEVNRLTMIVRRGMDSSTWNTMAQAYNAARAGWLNCASGSPARPEFGGAAALLDPFCPGKVMRLMAADLAWWHQASGGDVDPDTAVWATLPLPWLVIDGSARCTRADVEAACRQAGVDPVARGWTAPRPPGAAVEFTPTPELVHGVSIADPSWAALLRREGAFSGKGLRGDLPVTVPHGVVTSDLPVKDTAGNYLGSTGAGQV